MEEETYDAIVVGAGLSGGLLTARLAASGVRVACLEQGTWPDYGKVRAEFDDFEVTAPRDWARDPNTRAAPTDYPVDETASDITPLMWNGVGGSTVLYSAKWHRMTPSDFRVRSLDGVADDWPVSYDELEPYYVEAERQLGVSGLAGDPAYPKGEGPPNPPVPIRETGRKLARAHNALGWHWWPGSNAISTREYGPLKPCRQHGTCMQGCPEGAKASTDLTHWPAALRRGARLVTEARVLQILTEQRGAAGVVYQHPDGTQHALYAPVVVLAANGIGTPRLLLTSAKAAHSDGLANSSGLVGANLMMHPFAAVAGVFTDEVGATAGAWGQQIQSMQFYETDSERGFVRGAKWGLQPTGGPVGLTRSYPWALSDSPMWYAAFHSTMRARLGHSAMWSLVAEDLPEPANRVELSSTVEDSSGLPAPKIIYRVSENSRRMLHFHTARAVESLQAAGAVETVIGPQVRASGWHLMGTARMGTDPMPRSLV
jgi:choline dehydrogenase-like flavoprotein